MKSLIYHQEDVRPDDPVGGKAGALAALRDQGFQIPPWFVFSPASLASNGDSEVEAIEFSQSTLKDLSEALVKICPDNELVAVRSSAMEEDGALHSFAGQFDTFLSTSHSEVSARITDVWQSAFSDRVLNYRQQRGVEEAPTPPAVLIQQMVDADISGIAFGADPVTGNEDEVVISAIDGLGEALVSGEKEGQTYRVDDRDRVSREFDSPSFLTDEQTCEIASLARRAGDYFGCPQDVEWAVDGDKLFLLQSRPITTLAATKQGELNLWDNSNIVESYRGITTPLTYTFARTAYEGVYRQFCRILSVSPSLIRANDATFKNMLGWINGRIYYNLLNWYRVLAMLPGYKINRRFMEQMMGVKEPLSDEVEQAIGVSGGSGKIADGFRLLISIASLIGNLITLKYRSRRFYKRLANELGKPAIPLELMTAEQLSGHYRDLENSLLTRWDAPLINDFFCMIFYGVLKSLCIKWGPGEESLQEELLQDTGKMISAEPVVRLRELAMIARKRTGFINLLISGKFEQIDEVIINFPEFKNVYEDYLEKFGERCVEELKLETPTLNDDPLPLLRTIGHFSKVSEKEKPNPKPDKDKAATKLDQSLTGHPFRKLIFHWVCRQARDRVRERENLRFERTRVFGRVRRIFVEIGKRFHDQGRLENSRDIFYLEINEILEFADCDDPQSDLQMKVKARKDKENQYRDLPAPPDRFETYGEVGLYIAPDKNSKEPDKESADFCEGQRRGLGCSIGNVRGVVRVVHDPRNSQFQPGEILVAQSTDPGWILLFPLALGIIVERGSPLSHSAIVSRELGIPAVVALQDATSWLQDGDTVELNGETGFVTKC